MAEKESLRDKIRSMGEETSIGLKQGRPVAWHRLLMCGTLCLTGLILIAGIVMNYIMNEQAQTLQHQPVVGVVENTRLPAGKYYIFRVFLDAENRYHFVVSSTEGGVLVAVAPPEDTAIPDDIVVAQKYDSASYNLQVTEDGSWIFFATTVYQHLIEKQHGVQANMQAGTVQNPQ